tara:strand:- start:134 stop:442 length:309 start_codon:yes stop_codon:yes gene_type:complete
MATKKELEIEIQRLEERLESAYEQRNQIIENGSEWTKKYENMINTALNRIEQLEGFIRTLVDENPSIFCCFNCIPNAPNPPRHIVDVFGLGLENECECKEDE